MQDMTNVLKSMNPYKIIIFDLDDTLILEKDYIDSGFLIVSKYLHDILQLKQENIYTSLQSLYTKNKKYVFNRFLKMHSLSKKQYQEVLETCIHKYKSHIPAIHFSKSVIEMLIRLRKHYRLAIITDGDYGQQMAKLYALQAYKYIDYCVITDALLPNRKGWKPASDGFQEIKEYFKVSYQEMMYIGDNRKKDFYIHKIYPIYTVEYMNSNRIHVDIEYLESIKPCLQIQDFNVLLEFLKV